MQNSLGIYERSLIADDHVAAMKKFTHALFMICVLMPLKGAPCQFEG